MTAAHSCCSVTCGDRVLWMLAHNDCVVHRASDTTLQGGCGTQTHST